MKKLALFLISASLLFRSMAAADTAVCIQVYSALAAQPTLPPKFTDEDAASWAKTMIGRTRGMLFSAAKNYYGVIEYVLAETRTLQKTTMESLEFVISEEKKANSSILSEEIRQSISAIKETKASVKTGFLAGFKNRGKGQKVDELLLQVTKNLRKMENSIPEIDKEISEMLEKQQLLNDKLNTLGFEVKKIENYMDAINLEADKNFSRVQEKDEFELKVNFYLIQQIIEIKSSQAIVASGLATLETQLNIARGFKSSHQSLLTVDIPDLLVELPELKDPYLKLMAISAPKMNATPEKVKIQGTGKQALKVEDAVPFCLKADLCAGDSVWILQDGIGNEVYRGKVTGVFPDGTYSLDSVRGTVKKTRSKIAMTRADKEEKGELEYEGLKIGDHIVVETNDASRVYDSKVLGFFPDGKVAISWNGEGTIKDRSKIAKKTK